MHIRNRINSGITIVKHLHTSKVFAAILYVTFFCLAYLWAFFLSGTELPDLRYADKTFPLILTYALETKMQFGKDIVFTYGPLGFLNTVASQGDLIAVRTLFAFFWSGVVAWSVVKVGRKLTLFARLIFISWFFLYPLQITAYPLDTHSLLVIAVSCLVLTGAVAEQKIESLVYVVVLAVLCLVKLTFLVLVFFVIALSLLAHFVKRDYNVALSLLFFFGIIALFLWILTGQDPGNFISWILTSFQITSGYTQAMSLMPEMHTLLFSGTALLLFSLTFGIIALRGNADLGKAVFIVILLLSVFVSWKHGFVRADDHVYIYMYYLPLAFSFLFLKELIQNTTSNEIKILQVMLLLSVFCCSAGTYFCNHQARPFFVLKQNIKAKLVTIMRAATGRVSENYGVVIPGWIKEPDFEHAKFKVGRESLDILGYQQLIAFSGKFKYTPRPIIQSYSVYTHQLQDLNLNYYKSKHRPKWLAYQVGAIDGRFPLLEDATVLPYILCNYQLEIQEHDFLFFHDTGRFDAVHPSLLHKIQLAFGKRLSLSQFGGDPLVMNVYMERTLLGRMIGFFYQPPQVTMVVTVDGRLRKYRFIPAMAERGVMISPFIAENADLIDALEKNRYKIPENIEFDLECFPLKNHKSIAKYLYAENFTVEIYRINKFH